MKKTLSSPEWLGYLIGNRKLAFCNILIIIKIYAKRPIQIIDLIKTPL